MNYEQISNFEINKAVSGFVLCKKKDFEDIFFSEMTGTVSLGDGANWREFDPCNNPSDAWPIIIENKINIDHRESIKADPMASVSGNKEIYFVDKNPLRAAMIVFLMMKDAG